MIFHLRYSKLCVLLTTLLSACVSTNPATGQKNFTLMGEQQEFSMGKEVAQEAIKTEGEYTQNPALTVYYQDIAEHLVHVSERSDKPFEFIMLDSPTFNAWAVPGFINMYRGILPFFNSEAEFVSVMAHEMGHVTARHSAQQFTKGTIANVLVTGIAIYAGTQIDNAAVANAAYAAGAIGATLTLQGYSRAHEAEADRLALRYMSKMGYDPRESYRMFQTMGRYHDLVEKEYGYFHNGEKLPKSPFYSLLLSHPEPETRMAQVQELVGLPDGGVILPAGIEPATLMTDPQGQKRFYKMINGLPFGPKKEKGIAGDSVLYHPILQFKWQLPSGFVFSEVQEKDGDNIVSTWEAYNAEQQTWAFQRTESIVQQGSGKDLLEKTFPNIKNIMTVKIQDKVAYMGTVTVIQKWKNWQAGTYQVLATPAPTNKNDGHDFIITALGQAQEESFTMHVDSFKKNLAGIKLLSAREAGQLKPLYVDIYTVKSSDTVASLSQQMAMGALKEDWFRTLNGLDQTDALEVGQLVKIIRDPNL